MFLLILDLRGRLGDIDTETDLTISGSPNVFTNFRSASRVGDFDNDLDMFISGSPNVFIN